MAFVGEDLQGIGGEGFGGDDGGGVPGTPTGNPTSPFDNALPFGEEGGVIASTFLLLFPVEAEDGSCYLGLYDVDSFDDQRASSTYSYREEDVKRGRVPTVNRVRLIYRDLGLAKLTVTVQAVNDDGEVVTRSVDKQIGNKIATEELLTKIVDIDVTGYRPTLSFTRPAGGGPVSIVSATMEGTVEE